ncbi:hypothetical protein XELAEV_18024025mg [Xenopus laevis]|nr:hypothetical protein XELAEV_18024025mg [Xenopus laevis]
MHQSKSSISVKKAKEPKRDAFIYEAFVKKSAHDPSKDLGLARSTRDIVEAAIKDKKIFSISGCYPVLRNCLLRRGWVEKTTLRTAADANKLVDPDVNARFKETLLLTVDPNFLWNPRADAINHDSLRQDQMINHFKNAKCFTTKAGLCTLMDSMRWFSDVDPYSFVPRCYRLRQNDERQEFINDFIQTAARGILKWVSDSDIPEYPFDKPRPGQKRWIARHSYFEWLAERTTHKQRVKSDIILKSIEICQTYLDKLQHKKIDQEETKPKPTEFWKDFLKDYSHVIHDGATIENAAHYATRCHSLLHTLETVCPQIDIEGERNIWIIKPGAKSQGRGIICKNNLEDIMSLLDKDPVIPNEDYCVIQKYIERPLLIHGTKFDVRQWFLVTDWNPLTIWFYKRCYLRFSSQPFSVKNLSRSIHLCNNAVQKHCKNSPKRHPDLPEENMWHDYQFKEYLQMTGASDAWDDIILPGMKEIIIHTMKSAQNKVEHRKNSFHLYGADFMFGENFQPWLIEINSSPALSNSTSVSSKLSTQVQEDILRVVLDRKEDSKCDVGDFELLFKQPKIEIPTISQEKLLVKGVAIQKPCLLEKQNTPRVMNCQTFSKPNDLVYKEKNIKVDLASNLKKMDILPRKIVLDDIKGGTKPVTVKERVLPKLPILEYKQPKPERKLRDHSKERVDLYPITQPQHLKVKDTMRKLDYEKEKPKPCVYPITQPHHLKVKDTVRKLDYEKEKTKPCRFCRQQICTCHKPTAKKAFITAEFPSDLWKRRK